MTHVNNLSFAIIIKIINHMDHTLNNLAHVLK